MPVIEASSLIKTFFI